jgi:hypothetical protein
MDWPDLTLIDKLHASTCNAVVNDPWGVRPHPILRVCRTAWKVTLCFPHCFVEELLTAHSKRYE